MADMPDILFVIVVFIASVMLVLVVRARHRSHRQHMREMAEAEVCEHLRPALELLLARGHEVRRVGQERPDHPLEIHIEPPFDPQEIHSRLSLDEPVYLSERNVLYCREDWCELHPWR